MEDCILPAKPTGQSWRNRINSVAWVGGGALVENVLLSQWGEDASVLRHGHLVQQ